MRSIPGPEIAAGITRWLGSHVEERKRIPHSRRNDLNQPRTTGVKDVARLGLALAVAALRHPLDFSAESVFRNWARLTAARLGCDDLMVDFFVKKLLLIGSPELSRAILAETPRRDRFSAGALKRSGMAFLAAHALTISDDQEWTRRRAFNEAVLEPGRRHELASHFVHATFEAFKPPIGGVSDLRAAMGRAMLGVVFGGKAPSSMVGDIETLFGLVQDPVKRILVAPYAYWKRRRLYHALRALWQEQRAAATPSLLRVAGGAEVALGDTELLEQVPHWMFTFTGSATDLVTRTLALVTLYPAMHGRAMTELDRAGPIDESSFDHAALPFLEACLLEAGHLYPPVTYTFHRAVEGAKVGEVDIPAGTEIMHFFPLFTTASGDGVPMVARFNPERWMQEHPPQCSFDPFLGGARRCPGRTLILLICRTALASLLIDHRVVVQAPGIGAGPLPAQFPRRGIHFLRCC
jgi:cytochrome P450